MDHTKIQQWLAQHTLVLEENFPEALRRASRQYKKDHGLQRLDEVYDLIGISKQAISYWSKNICNTQTKKFSI